MIQVNRNQITFLIKSINRLIISALLLLLLLLMRFPLLLRNVWG